MRDPKRIPIILKTLKKLWQNNPDLRLGQLICNMFEIYSPTFFNMEDNEVEEYFKKYLKE